VNSLRFRGGKRRTKDFTSGYFPYSSARRLRRCSEARIDDRVPRRERWILQDPQFHPREFVPCECRTSSVDKSFGVISRRRVELSALPLTKLALLSGANVALPEMHQRSLPRAREGSFPIRRCDENLLAIPQSAR